MMTMNEAEVERDVQDRAGLLLARLYDEAATDVCAVHAAAFSDGGFERLYNADSAVNVALRRPAAQLTRADARRRMPRGDTPVVHLFYSMFLPPARRT